MPSGEFIVAQFHYQIVVIPRDCAKTKIKQMVNGALNLTSNDELIIYFRSKEH